jgi:ATP-dependent DNA helicase UvrD/PcrA
VKSHSPQLTFIPGDRQIEAIQHVQGPMLVVAGAGTGKTSVLTHRIAHLVEQSHARPDEIVALTYTRNAAAEMRERVRRLLGGKTIRAATFHDYCNGLLKRAHKDFGVLDDKDLWIFLRHRIRELRLEYFVRAANVSQFLCDLLEFISRCHDELVTPAKYAQYVEQLERGELPIPRVAKSKSKLDDSEVLGRCREIARVYATVERWLEEKNYGTFSHMITRAHALLQNDEALLAEERARASFILADEFQDANFAQIRVLTTLAGASANVFAVGDPDQAIYRFRGASSAAFEIFRHHFPAAKLMVLGKNRRSTTPILRCAFAVIDKNPQVFAANRDAALAHRRTPLQSAREEQAAAAGQQLLSVPVSAVSFTGRQAEGPDVVGTIRDLQRKLRCKWSDFGILYRLHSHRDEVVNELAEANIPFTIENLDVFDTTEVRDLFACVGAVSSAGDDVSLFRVAALPQFNVDPEQLRAAMRSIATQARNGRVVPLVEGLDGVAGGPAVLGAVQQAREEVRRNNARGRVAVEIIASRFHLDCHSAAVNAALKFIEDWEEKAITKTRDLPEFLEYLKDFREAGGVISIPLSENENAVRLMTAHLAKGLEFPHVFILRANPGSFPLSYRETLVEFPNELRDPDSAAEEDTKTLHSQEERRLFYVAMTRARDSLHLYAKQGTGADKTPPGYVRELAAEKSLGAWLMLRQARGSQAKLEIFAEASPMYPVASRTAEWLGLPASPGLNLRLSASAVDTYERCPLQFKLERDWRMAREVSAALQYGAAMHRVLRTYYDSVRLGRPRSDEELIEQFRSDLLLEKIQDKYQHELYERQGTEQLKDFLAAARSLNPSVLHTEQEFEIKVEGTNVVGRIDRIDQNPDGSVAIIDYKTGKARDQEDADESLQLSIYALAAQEKWGYRVDSLIFHNLQENVAVATRRSQSQLADARDRILAVAQGIAEERFEPNVQFHCGFCPYRNLCPAKEKRIPTLVTVAPARLN